jgi:hypothetical protein
MKQNKKIKRFRKVVEVKSRKFLLGFLNLICVVLILIFFRDDFLTGIVFIINLLGFIYNICGYFSRENRKVYFEEIK